MNLERVSRKRSIIFFPWLIQSFMGTKKEADIFINTVSIFLKDIAIVSGISKYPLITIDAGKLVRVNGMELSSGKVLPELESDKGSKCLGILEAHDMIHTEIKDRITEEIL